MTKYPDYNRATNAAYEALSNYEGNFPQIDIFEIVLSYRNIRIHTYSDIAESNKIAIDEFVSTLAPSEYGFTIYDKENHRYLIFFNDTKIDTTIRFTIAHEFGHIVLEHQEDGKVEDKEADCFARNLLCPVPIRDELGLVTTEDYCAAFDISSRAAKVAIDKKSNDSYYITRTNYNTLNDKVYCYFSGCTLRELYGFEYGY